jgi:micrococcal nuclease
MILAALACTLVAIDGDTLRCGRERIRLLGIDPPEMRGHCRRGRVCVKGDPIHSKAMLARVLRGSATIQRVSHDRYGRTLATVRDNGVDLSCHQLASNQAIYVAQWDNGVASLRIVLVSLANEAVDYRRNVRLWWKPAVRDRAITPFHDIKLFSHPGGSMPLSTAEPCRRTADGDAGQLLSAGPIDSAKWPLRAGNVILRRKPTDRAS